ncbi:Phthiocerol synthesis polyketide synthase type I PpsC [Rubripirellula amarantea]|uniref:Phthiocerol synthesis polyketide synthase type I PpsC n=1 Tax=Rubripirellula amarantea TaxID=2527999 RepID=A0A5C5WI20_9BACT|nr:type I polyketide synthase [Rubripirellula amarantea]TWT49653.1 Phthiocerol synthesis polyketide synthase type I PpsC [Rubripirellula amarantea]
MPDHTTSRSTLLTGATGMVGSYVMAEMLRRGIPMVVTARSKGRQSAAERIENILQDFEQAWNQTLPRPRVVEASFDQPGLGIPHHDQRAIANDCDQIIHSAASLSFAPATENADNEPYRTNVDGTRHLIKFCQQIGIKRWHQISTAYVCGTRSGTVRENENDVGQSFANDYERSKSIAEQMVNDAFRESNLTIYRPSIVIDRTGIAPVSGDRTIYGAFSMYQMLSAKFGLPDDGVWFRNLGFRGNERKNLVDVDWISRAVATIATSPKYHGKTYHLTTPDGTAIETLDSAFRTATQTWLAGRRVRSNGSAKKEISADQQKEIDQMADPFVRTFLPYFRDDPKFDRTQIDRVIAETDLDPTPSIAQDELLSMIQNWSAPAPQRQKLKRPTSPTNSTLAKPSIQTVSSEPNDPDDVVICGYSVRLPGNVNNVDEFEELLFQGRSAIDLMPADRLDRSLYFDSRRGVPGKTYTELGGCVDPLPIDQNIQREIEALGAYDLTHRQFAHVATAAFRAVFGNRKLLEVDGLDPQRGGVFVGHSGGTELGGPLAMATMAETATCLINETSAAASLSMPTKERMVREATEAIRQSRPRRQDDGGPHLNAYSAASLAAKLTGMQGRREVIDAACSSSLLALQHAALAIDADHLDLAIVGGATFNNVDNLALFSQSGACSDSGCHPFDRRASGLISSEGYVAIVLVRRRVAEELGLPIHAVLRGVGVASDGKGKGLWAPRSEGQQLAMKRARVKLDRALQIDYLECHATSTQVGDATELESLTTLLRETNDNSSSPQPPNEQLPIGSVKSNLGHLLEAAGLVGMVKVLLSMRRGQIPPSINFAEPTDLYQWNDSPIKIVDTVLPWPKSQSSRVAGVNAFGIGGLNAHAIIEQENSPESGSKPKAVAKTRKESPPIAIVGRGVILPGADSIEAFGDLLASQTCQITDPPADRWLADPFHPGQILGCSNDGSEFSTPHCRGGYVTNFKFDAQSYRIPPKLVRNANPAQLMLIEATRQAIEEFDNHQWTVDRKRVGVAVGTIFGGEFSNQLQIGLRLPEIGKHLAEAAARHGIGSQIVSDLLLEYRELILERYPALLDETGGFTASTLASAIARVFNLMGGAYAVDADEASSGLALMTAIERLNTHDVDVAICGATHRAMDLVAFDQLYRKHQLVESGRVEDLPNNGSRIFPGEGVASMILQRLDDAITQGRKIYGVIDGVKESWSDNVQQSRNESYQRSINHDKISGYQLVRTIGHLGGAQGLVQTIAATIADPNELSQPRVTSIEETADDGYQISYRVSRGTKSPIAVNHDAQSSFDPIPAVSTLMPARESQSSHPITNVEKKVSSRIARDLITLRLEAGSPEQMQASLQSVISSEPNQWVGEVCHFSHDATGVIQAGIVGQSFDEVRETAKAILEGPFASSTSKALPRHCGWIRFPSCGSRSAWLFPGQGSQYAEKPELICNSELSQGFLDEFDAQLTAMGLEPVGHRLDDPRNELGRNIWWTQLWVLAVGTTMTQSMLQRGHRPDVVLGHSFGECTAAWCAGVMSTQQAIQFAKYRSDAVITAAATGGELLSVRAEPAAIDAALSGHDITYFITHHNAPEQTVIAGSKPQIANAKAVLASANLASIVIPVPAAFHTPSMKPAQDLLRVRFGSQVAKPPRFGFLSAISNRYLAEPLDIITNLIDQLTRPVCFTSAVERLAHDGCGLFIEVGPSDVLTRLAKSTLTKNAICLSADDRGRPLHLRTALIDLACEAFTGSTIRSATSNDVQQPPSSAALTSSPSKNGSILVDGAPSSSASKFDVVDVTRRNRGGDETIAPSPASRNGNANGVVHRTPKPGAAQPNRYPSAIRTTNEIASIPAVASNQANPQEVRATSPASVAKASVSKRESAKAFLFDLVVDLTGYDPEIIEFDADLEGELGVDSIKKAQLIGEVVQWGNLEIDMQSMRLAQFASLADILALVGEDDTADNAVSSELNTHVDAPASSNEDISESLQRMIIDLVVDQTGYDESIIDMDADLEGELGVDSIKRAQLLGELETQYELQSIREQNLRLSDFPTLASIHAYVLKHLTSADSEKEQPANQTANHSGEKKKSPTLTEQATYQTEPAPLKTPAQGTHRFVLRTCEAPRYEGTPNQPRFSGPALIVGDNPIADAIIKRWKMTGLPYHQIGSDLNWDQIDSIIQSIWKDGVSQHLFLTTPHDAEASWSTLDARAWQARKVAALSIPYRVCQLWMQKVIDDELMDQSSLVSFVRNGGQFGFDAGSGENLANRSAESGGIAGLTKAMLIEAWMRGYRDTPMLVVDGAKNATADAIVDGGFRELAVPSYDEEVIVDGPLRRATRAQYQPIPQANLAADRVHSVNITPGGVWLVAGGGRGITAMTAMELAQRHGLKLHLLGMAKAEPIDPHTRERAQIDRAQLRRDTMNRVQQSGGNPVKHWRNYEKAIEIDQTLQQCRERGIEATYHSVDVSDAQDVAQLVASIRRSDGPIRGVIQGAGSGQDARFDRKRPDKVQQCLDAKIDGCVSLAAATQADPLEWFVGFGSISGRFGANGHTDYSAANDMLSKIIGRLRAERPHTKCVTFHWHAWGDVGMATKPEAKLALDMIGMEFMPAQEGLQHFLNEIENGGDDAEVLITDRRYVRKFFPNEQHTSTDVLAAPAAMLDPSENGWSDHNLRDTSFKVTLDPERDLFLKEHLVQGRPTLPFVMAIEMLSEAASIHQSLSSGKPQRVSSLRNVQAIRPLKCLTDDAFAVELIPGNDSHSWKLVSDLRRRDGRLVEAAREHFTASVELEDATACKPTRYDSVDLLDHLRVDAKAIEYMPEDAPVYHGPSLQCLREIEFAMDGQIPVALGTIVAPSPAHLAGESRPLVGWTISPATMDAVLYAAGMLAYQVGNRPSLPVLFDEIELGRLPHPGEPLRVVVRWVDSLEESTSEIAGGRLSAVLAGQNRDLILRLDGYRVGWLS